MVYPVQSLGLHGITGYPVSVECDLSGGLPAFTVVGLPGRGGERGPGAGCAPPSKTAASPSRSAGSPSIWPPAHVKKLGTLYDLPILVGLLAAGAAENPGGGLRLPGGALPCPGSCAPARDAAHGPGRPGAGRPKALRPRENAAEATPGLSGPGDLSRGRCSPAGAPLHRRGAHLSPPAGRAAGSRSPAPISPR